MRSRPPTDNTKVLPGQKNENMRVIYVAVLSVVTGLERACRQRLAPLLLSFTLSPLISNLPEVITAQCHICQQSVKPCREFKSCCRALRENWRKTAISSAQRVKWSEERCSAPPLLPPLRCTRARLSTQPALVEQLRLVALGGFQV